ncbi:MAG: MFS transporter [Candidatus Helarchaeota archaeon]
MGLSTDSEKKIERPHRYILYLVIFMIINDIFDTYTTNLPNVIGSFVIKDFGISESVYAIVTAVASVGTYVAFILQALSDYGRKRMLFIVLFGTGLFSLLLGLSPTIEFYIIFLFLLYITFSSDIWTIVMNEESPKEKRGYYTNIVLIFGVLGAFLVILFRETLFYVYGWRSLTWFGILAMPLAFLTFLFKESKKFEEFSELEVKKEETFIYKFKKINTHRDRLAFFVVFLISFLVGLNYIVYALGEPYFSIDRQFAHSAVSLIMTLMGLGALLGYLLNVYLLDSLGRKPTICIYVATTFLSFLLILFGDFELVLISSLIFSTCFWGLFSSLRIVCIEVLPTDIRGVGTGIRSFYFALGFTVGSILAAVLEPFLSLGGVFLLFATTTLLIIPLILIFIKETKGLELELT